MSLIQKGEKGSSNECDSDSALTVVFGSYEMFAFRRESS